MQENQIRYEDDEIDLRELFKTIWDGKIFIAIFTSIVTVLAIVYAMMKTPIYEVKSNVQIGYIGDSLLDDPGTIVKKLSVIFDLDGEIEKEEQEFISKVSGVSQNKQLNNFIEIKTEAISNEEALKKNQEVIKYLQDEYRNKIELFKADTKHNIENKEQSIKDIDGLEVKNIQEQIKILKEQKAAQIDKSIDVLKNQEIKRLEGEIDIYRKQEIPKIESEIQFFQKVKLKTIEAKISFHTKKLDEYQRSISKLYETTKESQDTITTSISSMQMVNYQNLILNSQNKIEDLKIEKKKIETELIPQLQHKKTNIINISVKKLSNEIQNIKNIKIVDLEKQKENIFNEDIRKLRYALDITIPNKKLKIGQEIDQLKYDISPLNVQNSKVIGEYIVKKAPAKPKKKLIVVVAFVTGFILSIFLVFFAEFIRGFKEEEMR